MEADEAPAQARAQPQQQVETSVTVLPFGYAEATFRTAGANEQEPDRKMPFVIPLETSVIGTQYDSPLG
jgi:hypothetical protein